ncbi:uncharacterized protein DUF4184 [Paenibacillus cellulosilyticus]|uniref:Uncharacterized protein DUF4184 n=1 Tax=Paenibacillus cellulosilyticus TaxID=375489 RepID=A0A2V2YPV9_9BACL|nr:DUF4184 family protein [Paenibacillus cellulosilyticus]PWV94481.1 uncharacterized protein DUF4184 [Paenibacillus cellulosilyticus]QKS44994.1 DUF4184 family protein [Paenibacillus cellulosilyticus]
MADREGVIHTPFTFAHPLYAIPLKAVKPRYLSVSGLILGSMSPDFEYFLALEPRQTIGHTFKGLLLETIPLCVILLILTHLMIKSFTSHLPSIAQLDVRAYQRIRLVDLRSLRSWIVFIVSVIIGFYSHLFVDAFTHESGYFVLRHSSLQHEYFSLPLYKLLQYLLSLIGMAAEFILLAWMLFRTPVYSDPNKVRNIHWLGKIKFWCIVTIITIGIVTAKLALTTSTNTIGILVVAPISGVLAGIAIASLICRDEIKIRK